MKALTVREPWVTLIVAGKKSIETRAATFPVKYKGPLAIHASKKLSAPDEMSMYAEWPFADALAGLAPCPRGAVVAVCTLAEVVRIDVLRKGYGNWSGLPRKPGERMQDTDIVLAGSEPVPDAERPFGLWETGRKALIIEDVRRIVPVPAKGKLGLWDWDGPVEYLS